MVVLDTCALIESVKTHPTFSPATLSLIEEGAIILSISFAEIACKVKLGKLQLDVSVVELYQKFLEIRSIEIVAIGVQEWLDTVELDWKDNKDPADRMITAFAMKKRLPIVTSDQKIKRFYSRVLW